MDIQNIIKDLQKWQAENKDNRSVLIIASECIAKSDNGKCTNASTAGIVGTEGQLVSSISRAIQQDTDFTNLISKAIKAAAIGMISKTIKDDILS